MEENPSASAVLDQEAVRPRKVDCRREAAGSVAHVHGHNHFVLKRHAGDRERVADTLCVAAWWIAECSPGCESHLSAAVSDVASDLAQSSVLVTG